MSDEKTSCPSNDLLINVFFAPTSDEEKEALVDHIFACPFCRIKFEALESLGRQLKAKEANFPDEALTSSEAKAFNKMAKRQLREIEKPKQPISFYFMRKKTAFAAVALVVLIISGFIVFKPFSQSDIFRDTPSREFRVLEPKGIVESPPMRFHWTDYPGSDGYFLQIVDENLRTVMTVSEQTTSYSLKDDPSKIFERGKYYFWSVMAKSDDGIQLAIARESFIIKGPS